MDQKIFAELLESANEALEHAKGKRELRTTELPPPPKPVDGGGIRRLRTRLKMSQAVFARYLNVSTKLVQAWESDRRTPVTVETGPPGIPPLAGIVSLGPVVSWQVVPSRTNACSTGEHATPCQFIPRSPLGGSRARGGWRSVPSGRGRGKHHLRICRI